MAFPVTVLVLAGNEERNIAACLDSVREWSDDIVVVDSHSTDATVAMSKDRGATVVVNTYVDHASQLRWALGSAPLKHDWILFLDADNVVTDELKTQIADAIGNHPQESVAYYSLHHEYFRGYRIRGAKRWWLRIFRNSRTQVDNSELVDYRLVIDGPIGRLSGAIIEDNRKEDDLDFWTDKHQRFALRMAAEEVLRANGRLSWHVKPRFFGTPDERRVWLKQAWLNMPLHVRPWGYFLYRYLCTGEWLGGRRGFEYAFHQALWFRMLVDSQRAGFERDIRNGTLTADDLWNRFGAKLVSGHIAGASRGQSQ